MELKETLASVLAGKRREVWWIPPQATVYEAIAVMAEKGVGALLVMSGDKLEGIISERDYARKVILKNRSSHDTPVDDIMTASPVSVAPEDTVHHCMQLMTEGRFRHLPVMKAGRVVGMLSIGDLVKAVIQDQTEHIQQLERYIAG